MFKRLFGRSDKDKEEKKKAKEAVNSALAPAPAVVVETLTKDDFETLDVLGKGSFAHVVLVRRISTGQYYAMKVVANAKGASGDAYTERNILSRCSHPCLLKLHHTFQSEGNICSIVDYMPGGDLNKYMNSMPNKTLDLFTAKLYGAEILLAIQHLHENNVMYRDLKPENILMSADGHCALADFGLSKDCHTTGAKSMMRANSFVGSPLYVAPDVLQEKEYTRAVDFWAFGILLFRMLCGRPPFNGPTMKDVFENILFSPLRFPSNVAWTPEAKDLISRLLSKDAGKRMTGPEVRAHPFFEGIDFNDVAGRKVAPPHWVPLASIEEMLPAPQMLSAFTTPEKVPEKQPGQEEEVIITIPGAVNTLQPTKEPFLLQGFSCTTEDYYGSLETCASAEWL